MNTFVPGILFQNLFFFYKFVALIGYDIVSFSSYFNTNASWYPSFVVAYHKGVIFVAVL